MSYRCHHYAPTLTTRFHIPPQQNSWPYLKQSPFPNILPTKSLQGRTISQHAVPSCIIYSLRTFTKILHLTQQTSLRVTIQWIPGLKAIKSNVRARALTCNDLTRGPLGIWPDCHYRKILQNAQTTLLCDRTHLTALFPNPSPPTADRMPPSFAELKPPPFSQLTLPITCRVSLDLRHAPTARNKRLTSTCSG